MFGSYSDKMIEFGVRVDDMIILENPTVVRTKLKFKQVTINYLINQQ